MLLLNESYSHNKPTVLLCAGMQANQTLISFKGSRSWETLGVKTDRGSHLLFFVAGGCSKFASCTSGRMVTEQARKGMLAYLQTAQCCACKTLRHFVSGRAFFRRQEHPRQSANIVGGA